MLARGTDELRRAQADGRALAAINLYTVEYVVAVVDAAEATGQPALLQIPSRTPRRLRNALAAAALDAAADSAVPIGVHLDHSTDPGEIRECVAAGFTSVMIDGSQLDFEANVALTAEVVAECHRHGVWVEGEIGSIGGDEHRSTDAAATAGDFTDPAQAAEFAARTGVDALAVAVGTVHGFTPHPTHVDLDQLRRIRDQVATPLVLHGASGVPDDDLVAAVAAGITKVNVNAELRRTYLDALTAVRGDDVAALRAGAIAALTAHATAKIELFART